MKIYLYTENFISERFDLYQYLEDTIRSLGDGPEYVRVWSRMDALECRTEIDENGIAVDYGLVGVWSKIFVSFKVLINEVAPCGRKRLVLGCTEPISSSLGILNIETQVRQAVEKLMTEISISIPRERLDLLEKKVAAAKRQVWKRFCGRVVLAGLLMAGVALFAKMCIASIVVN